ncbi:MAG: hypothetical protein WA215_03150 [Candidatus Cybelea sp.]
MLKVFAMCTIDWSALGTWVGATGTWAGALFLGAAVLVALSQIRVIRANEVVRATIDYLARFTDSATIVAADVRMSPALAGNIMAFILSSPEREAVYRAEIKGFYDGTLRQRKPDRVNDVERFSMSSIVAANYFLSAESLLRRGRLDKDIFLETVAPEILRAWKFAQTFKGVDQNAAGLVAHLRFPTFAEEVKLWYEEHVAEAKRASESPAQAPAATN